MTSEKERELVEGFREVINRASVENESNTPDFVLAEYLLRCLVAFDAATNVRTKFSAKPAPLAVSAELIAGCGKVEAFPVNPKAKES